MRNGSALLASAVLALSASSAGAVGDLANVWDFKPTRCSVRHPKKSSGTHKQNRRKALRAKGLYD